MTPAQNRSELEAIRLHAVILLALRRNWLVAVAIFCAYLTVGLIDSIAFPRYESHARLLIPAHRDSHRVDNRALDVRTNERFLQAQIEALASDEVLASALRTVTGEPRPSPASIDALRSRLVLYRLPFENAVTLGLRGNEPDTLGPLIDAIATAYRDWLHNALTREALAVREDLLASLERLEARLQQRESLRTDADAAVSPPAEPGLESSRLLHRALVQRLAEVEVELSRNENISIELLAAPVPPWQLNRPRRNAVYSIVAATATVLLLAYLYAVRAIDGRGSQ